jgi:hypothetical protein
MSRTTVYLMTMCVCFVLLTLIAISGCTSSSSSGAAATNTVTPSPLATAASSPVASSGSSQTAFCSDHVDVAITGNKYATASNPSEGIDSIQVLITTFDSDLPDYELVFSTPTTNPVILTKGTTESISTFTSTPFQKGGATVKFKVKPVPASTKMTITVRPTGTTATTCSFTYDTPATITKGINTFY